MCMTVLLAKTSEYLVHSGVMGSCEPPCGDRNQTQVLCQNRYSTTEPSFQFSQNALKNKAKQNQTRKCDPYMGERKQWTKSNLLQVQTRT